MYVDESKLTICGCSYELCDEPIKLMCVGAMRLSYMWQKGGIHSMFMGVKSKGHQAQ